MRRSRLSLQARRLAAQGLRDRVIGSRQFLVSKAIATYVPVGGEIDTSVIVYAARKMLKRCYLPVLHPYRPRCLAFARDQGSTPMKANRVGIDEPQVDPKTWLGPQQLDLIFLPLVGFTIAGMRIGMGGGYYDATLEYLKNRVFWKKPALIGVGYDFQRFDVGQIPADSWDIRLDGVFTESDIYNCKG